MNIGPARFNMIEQQIRPWGVLNPKVIDGLRELDRQHFVPLQYKTMAYADIEVPLEQGQCMLRPKIEARLIQALLPTHHDDILEIGTGSGFMTALLATLGNQVTSVDIFPDFLAQTEAKLQSQGIGNVTLEEGDGALGWGQTKKWDAILLTASTPRIPAAYEALLKPGGRFVVVVGDLPSMEVIVITRLKNGALQRQSLFDTCIAPLINAQTKSEFQL